MTHKNTIIILPKSNGLEIRKMYVRNHTVALDKNDRILAVYSDLDRLETIEVTLFLEIVHTCMIRSLRKNLSAVYA